MKLEDLCQLPADAEIATPSQLDEMVSDLKKASKEAPAVKPTTITRSTTSQPATSIDGVVLAAREDITKTGGRIIRVLVVGTSCDSYSGDSKNGGYSFEALKMESSMPLVMQTEKLVNTTGRLLAMPRQLHAACGVTQTTFIEGSYYKTDKDDDSVVAPPQGAKIKLTGLTFDQPNKDGYSPDIKIKRFDVTEHPRSAQHASENIRNAMQTDQCEKMLALMLAPSIGGFEKIYLKAPVLATDLIMFKKGLMETAANEMGMMATRLENVVAGEGESYATPVLSTAAAASLTQKAAALADADINTPISALFGSVLKPPLLFEGGKPGTGALITQSPSHASKASLCARPYVYNITVEKQENRGTGVAIIYPTVVITACNNRALQSCNAGHNFTYNISDPSPTCAIKFSLRNAARMLGTSSLLKAAMLAKELIPWSPFVTNCEMYPLSGTSPVFGDKEGGSNWANFFDIDIAKGVCNVGFPVSEEFVRSSYTTDQNTVRQYDVPQKDKIAEPQWNVDLPSIAKNGVVAISEKTDALTALLSEHPNLKFRVVFDGAADAIKESPNLVEVANDAETFLKDKFSITQGAPKRLIAETLLYGVIEPIVATRPAADDDSSEDESYGKMSAKSAGKAERKKEASPY